MDASEARTALPGVSCVMPVLNEERHLRDAGRRRPGPGLRGPARGRPRPRALARTAPTRSPPSWPRRTPGCGSCTTRPGVRQRASTSPIAASHLRRSSSGSTGTRCSPRTTCASPSRPCERDRRRQRRRGHGRRGRHRLRARGGLRDDVEARRRQRAVPHRRRGRVRLPRSTSGCSAARRWTGSAATTRTFVRAQDWEMNHRIRAAAAWSGSRRSCRWPTGRAPACARWPGSTATTAAGAAWSCASTATPCPCATSRRRSPWSVAPSGVVLAPVRTWTLVAPARTSALVTVGGLWVGKDEPGQVRVRVPARRRHHAHGLGLGLPHQPRTPPLRQPDPLPEWCSRREVPAGR